ncbi:hypothetical protein Tco_0200837 [Tanacetum coccineum]
MIEEPVKPMKKKDLIGIDEEVALKLQADLDKEERLAREKVEKEQEANIALIETWDDIQAKIDVDHQLAERLMQHVQIYMLVKKKYHLTPSTLTMMLEKKLMIDYESEMAYQLLKFIERIVGIKSLLDAVRITVACVFVNTAQLELVLLVKI